MLSPFYFTLSDDKPSNYSNDEKFFLQALSQAHICMGNTHPNPNVGAVIVKHGQVIAKGYTHPPGGPHAEVHAIKQLKPKDLTNSTLYVTLEPCSHYGRTPPCTNAIIKAGISKVIYGALDPNPLVLGNGIAKLKNSGVDTKQIDNPKLKQKAAAINEPFKTWLTNKRPYTIVKISTSNDNKIARVGQRTKITCHQSDIVVHKLRRTIDAIIVGANTARVDDPELTARLSPSYLDQQPTRIVLNNELDLDPTLKIFDTTKANTIVVTSKHETHQSVDTLRVKSANKQIDLKHMLEKLGQRGFTCVMFEPGKKLTHSILNLNLADEIWWFKSNNPLGAGLEIKTTPDQIGYKIIHETKLGSDMLYVFKKLFLD